MGKLEVYSSKITIKTTVDLGDLYEYMYGKLLKDGWTGKYGEDRFEYYYYHRVVGNMWFVNINWQAIMNFWEEEPKIDWILDLNLRTVAYNTEKKSGEINISIKSSLDIEDFSEPKISSRTENILSSFFKLTPKFLLKMKNKVRKGKTDIEKIAARELFIYSEEFKKDIMNFLKGYYRD